VLLFRSGFVGAAALLFVARIGAQSPTVETPEANPGRPTVSTPATLTRWVTCNLRTADSMPRAHLSSQRYLVLTRSPSSLLYPAFSCSPYRHHLLKQVVLPAMPSQAVAPGEVFAGLAVVVPGEGHKPAVSLSCIRRLYASPAPEIDIGTFRNSALILVSDDLAGFHFDFNGIVSEQTKGTIRRGQFGQTLSISHPLGRLTVAVELWHFTQPLTSRNAVGNLWAVSYPARKNLVLDAGFDHGLTSSSTQWEAFAGFTYLLPHRLWGFHNPK
jgi:hypothetical protein